MQSDLEFLGLATGDVPGQYHFTVVERLARLDGRLYGGTAIAVSIAAAEALSNRSMLWMTTQFVSTVEEGAEVSVLAEVLAQGRRTNQLRVTGTSASGDVIFASIGATGIHRPDGLTGVFETCPKVQSPEDSERWNSPFTGLAKAAGLTDLPQPPRLRGFGVAIETREPEILSHPEPGPGRFCLWVRRKDGVAITPAMAAYLADVVPMGVAYALGVIAGGTSLDNTIRVGSFVESEWILLDLRPHMAAGGYGHGLAQIWSEDGQLMATAGQTASMTVFDISSLANLSSTD